MSQESSQEGQAAQVAQGSEGTQSKAIDWEEALKQAGGDLEFLTEVLHDLLDEAETAKNDIDAGLKAKNFDDIMKAAHRLKGSAAYLGCEAMRYSMMTIQHESKKGIDMTDGKHIETLLNFLTAEYEGFLVALENLKTEVSAWFEKKWPKVARVVFT